jgi:hypothetical protein
MITLALATVALSNLAGAANYIYEESSVKGVGYRNREVVISTETDYNGVKLVEKQSGSGNVISSRIELEVERQPADIDCPWSMNGDPMDYINLAGLRL